MYSRLSNTAYGMTLAIIPQAIKIKLTVFQMRKLKQPCGDGLEQGSILDFEDNLLYGIDRF